MGNRFTKAAQGAAGQILNAGKLEQGEDQRKEKDDNKPKEFEPILKDDYYSYKNITPQNSKISKTSDKYKVNYSFEEETLQKFLHMYISDFASKGRVDNKYYSIIAARAIELLYEVNYVLSKNDTYVLQDDITIKEILRRLSKCELE